MKRIASTILILAVCINSMALEPSDDVKNLKPLSNEQINEMFRNRGDDCSWEPVSAEGVTRRSPQQISCIVNAGVRPAIDGANFIGSFWMTLDAPKAGGKVNAKVSSATPLPKGLEEALVLGVSGVPLLFQVSEDMKGYRLWVHSCIAKPLPEKASGSQGETPPWAGPMTRGGNPIRIVIVTSEEKTPEQCRGEL